MPINKDFSYSVLAEYFPQPSAASTTATTEQEK
jgi:hypothetical protein